MKTEDNALTAPLFIRGGDHGLDTNSVTIDRTPNDAALAAVRNCFPGHADHIGNQEAAQNIARFGRGIGFIVGHGNQGFVVTNKGASPNFTDNDWMTCNNWQAWRSLLTALRPHVTYVKILACHVGAGDAGAALLWEIAVFTNVPASGPTGLVYPNANGTINYEPGTVWQIATPGPKPPIAIPPPTNYLFKLEAFVNIKFNATTGEFSIPLSAVTSVVYHRGPTRGVHVAEITPAQRSGILSMVDFERPFNPGGPPLAMVTGYIDISFAAQDGSKQTRTLTIYNDRLAHEAMGDTYYYINPAFSAMVNSLV